MSSDKEILALEDKRYAAMCSGDFAAHRTGRADFRHPALRLASP